MHSSATSVRAILAFPSRLLGLIIISFFLDSHFPSTDTALRAHLGEVYFYFYLVLFVELTNL